MSDPYLPPEVCDYIVDLLHNKPDTLGRCCLVSQSWVPRTRKHLFADIRFLHCDDLERWKRTFPDPSRSPAHHTHTLTICCPEVATVAGAQEGGWIRAFSNVTQLKMLSDVGESVVSLAPFHNFSPALKSLHVASTIFPCTQIFDLICSFRLLEDLNLFQRRVVIGPIDRDRDIFQPSTSPVLTGTLRVHLPESMEYATRRLLNLPGGLHFWKLECSCYFESNLQWMSALVAGCSDTLECVDIEYWISPPSEQVGPPTVSIDLSRATKLKEAVFRSNTLRVAWLVLALQSITSEHRYLHQISIHVPEVPDLASHRRAVSEVTHRQWMDLDRILVQLWESHGIRLKVMYFVTEEKKGIQRERIGGLLPKITERGVIELEIFVGFCWYRQVF
ncbi:hypothetical protein BDM02DRAFT_3190267 [Thelephora ganbajun]|uniref:Uncharacterized protein n=1 Tax=Thelephora ganbajun TaxID=370292 RepID=A0ACB6Z5M0_THEGA|nr:hypothetical protein BDM02DRAFT_3190267 [Thelephora ganbajun]